MNWEAYVGFDRAWARWVFAVAVFGAATWLNVHLQPLLDGRAPLLPYFPAVVLVGLLCGFAPALALLIASCAAILFFWIAPVGELYPINSYADLLLIALFFAAGFAVAVVAATASRLMRMDRMGRQRMALALTAGRMVFWELPLEKGKFKVTGDLAGLFGQSWSSFDELLESFSEADRELLQAGLARAVAQYGRFTHAAAFAQSHNGEVLWVQVDGEVRKGANDRALHVYGVVVDVTLQQRALRASQAAEERFQLALQSGKVMAWECDGEGKYTWTVNVPEGLSAASLVGVEVGSMMGSPNVIGEVLCAMRSGRAGRFTQRISRDGQVSEFLTTIQPVVDAGGPATRALGATVDVTELAAAQAQLQVESQRKDAFLATLAHELRNPMAPIRYAVANLLAAKSEDAKQRAADVIDRQSAHMSRLLDDLLDMSRITRNAVELQCEEVDLRSVVKQAVEAVEPLYAERRHRLSLSMPPTVVMVNCDPTRLQQVLGNLLDNAAKYSPVAGEVAVQLAVDSGQAKITVVDHGIGINADQQGQVFELFSRLNSSNSAPVGLGIGLAVSLQMMRLHGGTLTVDSAGLGTGSRFAISLPVSAGGKRPVDQTPARSSRIGDSQRRVLVVDDNRDGADSLSMLLMAEGFEVATANSGQEALEQVESFRPQVVLLDIGLPDISGVEVAQRIHASGTVHPSLIAVTGWGQQRDRDMTAEAGFDAHLIKPVNFHDLHRLIVDIAGGPTQLEKAARVSKPAPGRDSVGTSASVLRP